MGAQTTLPPTSLQPGYLPVAWGIHDDLILAGVAGGCRSSSLSKDRLSCAATH